MVLPQIEVMLITGQNDAG